MLDDRRLHARRALRTTATLTFADGQSLALETLDISWGGLALLCEANPPLGITADVMASLPVRGQPRLFCGSIQFARSVYHARESSFVIGARFTKMDSQANAVLADFLRLSF